MGDDTQWGSYPAYEKAQPQRKTQEQQDRADSDLVYLNAKAERGWNAQATTDPLWKFKLICGLMARYELLAEYDFDGAATETRKTTLKGMTRDLCLTLDVKLLARDYHARWLTAYFWGLEGLNKLDDRAKARA